jgi:hypothetical protein
MINQAMWREIQRFVTSLMSQQGQAFTQGKVVKRDVANKLVWLREFGDQPIPLVAFNYQVKYYVPDTSGNQVPKKTKVGEVDVLVPEIGDTVLVARHLGSRRLPKCLGVIQSTNYVTAAGGED